MSDVLFLCTGNATRSVIAGEALRRLRPDLRIETAGTFAVDGLPMSWRTRAAFDAVGLPWPPHRSKQATESQLDAAALVIAMAPEHVQWVRREHPAVAGRTATLKCVAAALARSAEPLDHRVAALELATRLIDPEEEIVDPGGAEVEAFVACAREVVGLVEQLADRL